MREQDRDGRVVREREREREVGGRKREGERGAEVTRPTPERERGQIVDDEPYQNQ